MKSIISLFVAALLVPSLALAQNIKKGDTAIVPGWEWVDVVNSERQGETCGIKIGGTVMVVGIDGSRLLVHYVALDHLVSAPSCPSGVFFFTTKENFSKMTAEYNRIRAAQQSEQDFLTEQLIKY